MNTTSLFLRRACAQLRSSAAWTWSSLSSEIGPANMNLRGLSSAAGIQGPVIPIQAWSPVASGSISGCLSLLATTQSFHCSAASLASTTEDTASAALRRLAAARRRRERLTEVATSRDTSPSSPEHGTGGAIDPHVQQQGAGVVPAGTTAVVPVEGLASDVQLAAALDHPALIITRPIEWGTVIFGYEQANKYTVYDETGTIVALVAEDFGGFGKELGRQLLRTRRSFTATIFSADGSQVLFRLRRPAYLVSSTMHVEDGAGNPVGEIHQRWNLMKRNYDLYINKSQFAAISGNFLAWEFELKDAQGGTLALVDRNFSGFAREIFTDAGKYVVHFGYVGQQLQQQQAVQQEAQQQQQQQLQPSATTAGTATAAAVAGTTVPAAIPVPAAGPSVTPMAVARTDVAVIPAAGGNQLVVARPLELSERMVALACAITIDYDYFSQHSRSGGGLVPPLVVFPGGGVGGEGETRSPESGPGVPEGPGAAAGVAGAAAGPIGDMPLGGSNGAAPAGSWGTAGPASSGTEVGGGGGEMGGGYGAGFDPGRSWGQTGSGDEEMKWDLGGAAADTGGGEEGGGITGLLRTLWGLFGGDE
ncbi:hypothetical protein Vafri_14423 [Volvox africanus]|uniref:Phospholipid scramblase n=1 Tax=Volvox africanus TaxID=51714 RepID=A0A8J4F7K4_9CHLO|nr:hypothetical protein Vafri_14423 [Volvox africanus]